MLFNYKDYVFSTAAIAWRSLTVTFYIAGDIHFLTLLVFGATLLAGMQFCVDIVCGGDGGFVD